eukprot:15185307-Alexandrium_andersonii.AAC.1
MGGDSDVEAGAGATANFVCDLCGQKGGEVDRDSPADASEPVVVKSGRNWNGSDQGAECWVCLRVHQGSFKGIPTKDLVEHLSLIHISEPTRLALI